MTRKSTLSPESAALIDHIKVHGACTAAALCPHFATMDRTKLLKRLGNLVSLGWIDFARDDAGEKTWFLRASVRAIAIHTTTPSAPCQTAPALPIAGPRRVNVMSGNYVPSRGPALRAGSLDFRTCPSVGYRC